MNSKILFALFVVGLVAVSMAQEDGKQDPKAVEMFDDQQDRPERDASFEAAAADDEQQQENTRVKRQWGYGGYGGYGYGYRPYRPWRRFGGYGYGYRPYGYGYYG